MLELLQTHLPLTATFTLLFGLVVGSFLNVVIYRLPLMLLREWQRECQNWINLQSASFPFIAFKKSFNLLWPSSHCPHCHHSLTALENIPVISFLWQKGKCTHCRGPISFRYLWVELLSAFLALIVVWKLNLTLHAVFAVILTWCLIALAVIDLEKQLLPDSITIPLLWLGLLVNCGPGFVTPTEAIIGACLGYMSLWSLYWIFKWITHKEGMGYGDFKLLAALGAWLGWQSLLGVILIASSIGAIVGLTLIFLKKIDRDVPIPFGPYLALGGWVILLWG
ncbi:MAG: prepilin peptidase [Gammaproteobacteria bacterium]|nr:prepilin peptidase [Gammaproteobacteria bacterium]